MFLPEIARSFLLFSAIFILILTVYGVIRARQKRERTFYLGITIGFLMSLVAFLAFLEQLLLAVLVFAFMGLLSFVAWPKTIRELDRMFAKTLQEVDFSVPLRMRDFLTTKGQLKMVSRLGVRKAVLLIWLFNASIAGGLASILTLLGVMNITSAITSTIVTSIFPAIIFHRQIRKIF